MYKLGSLHISNPVGAKHTATVIFFHGSGSSGELMKEWVRLMVKNFTFPHIKIMYPTAPTQPYTAAGGQMSNVWFDRLSVSPDVPEHLDSIAKIEVEVKKMIKEENDAGIPSNRIIVGGFSMGGSLTFHTAYRWDHNIAGGFVFGSFLNNNSIVYEEIKKNSGRRLPPLLQIHGDKDDMVDVKWAEDTFKQLKNLGVHGEFHVMPSLGHSINRKGMELIKEWIEKLLPSV